MALALAAVAGITPPAAAQADFAPVLSSDPADALSRYLRQLSSDPRNLEALTARLPGLAATAAGRPASARAAVRATTRDRLPVCGPVPGREGLHVIGGLGSRGFCVAPLLGAHVAALIAGSPSPLPSDMARRLEAARLAPNRP